MHPHGTCDTGDDAGSHAPARTHAAPGRPRRGRLRSRPARAATVLLAAVAALLALPLQAQAQATGICGRTAAVRTAILGTISGVSNCANVTDAHLAAITGTLLLYDDGISTIAAGDFDGLTALTELRLDDNSLSTLPAGVFDELTALTTLNLRDNSLSTLPAGVFDGLTALTWLRLEKNSLSTLPAGVFDELTALTSLWMGFNSLSTLPAGVFDELTALTVLYLYINSLSTLPDDVFEELTSLTNLQLQGNPGAPFSPEADALPDDGEVVVGPGGTVTLDGSGSDGGPWGTNVTYSWAASGATVTFDDAASATPVVTIPALTDGTELTFTLTVTGRGGAYVDTDTATVTAEFNSTAGICGRTEVVRDAIVGLISGVASCADVTDAHLAAITSLDLSNDGITALAAGDFDGLTALTNLNLRNNSLSTLPAGVFDGLTALTNLYLDRNSLSTLPAGVFDGLTALTTLRLYTNSLSTLPAGVFEELTALTNLRLDNNSLSTLPAGVFDELTALTNLRLHNNSLSTLPAGVFEELTALTTLRLQDNLGAPFSPTADALPDDGTVVDAGGDVTLDGSGSEGGPWGTNVTYSWAASGATVTFDDAASATPVVTIPALAEGTELTFTLTVTGRATDASDGSASDTDTATVTAVFDSTAGICGRTEQVRTGILALISGVTHCALVTDAQLAAITGTLNLSTKGITALAAGDFDGLTALTGLSLEHNSLSTLPAGVFDGLTALTNLILVNNSLSTLPAGVFDGLTALTWLQLHANSLETLPAGVFDELTALTRLWLYNNSLSTLPAGVFDELTALTELWLANNSLPTLPAGVFDELTALTTLILDNNSLSTLPTGVFDELTALTTLRLQDNPGAPFSPTADALPDDGTVVDAGGDVTLDGSGSDGGPWGTNVTYSWAASGATVTFDDAASATPVVTIPALADGTELTFTLTVTGRATNTSNGSAPATDTATVTAEFDSTAGICGRTEQVRDGIVALISGVTHCALVTDAQLAAITGTLDLDGDHITALAAGDFDGLTALTRLDLDNSPLSTLPAGVFDELTALTELALDDNLLSTLPAGVFDELTALTELDLYNNPLSTLPAGVFDELTALTTLRLGFNSLSTLPAGVFDGLTALTWLDLEGNPGAPFSPTADALPDDGTVPGAGGDVTLDGSGSDGGPWGTNVTYSWAASGAAVTFDDAASATPVVTIPALADGTELTFTLTVTGGAGTITSYGTAPDTDTATVTAVVANAAPAFTSAATFDAAENQTAVGTVVASDGDADDTVTGYAIQGGADRSTFSIVETTGVLTFASAPNFEAPADADTDNAYVVVVRAASGTGARAKTADQTITVTVTDVAGEAPGVPAAPLVSAASVTSVTAAWTAPANAGPPITDYDYRYRVTAPQGAWTEVTTTAITALSATITGLVEDTGYDVQVRATTDEGTSGWSASGSGSTDANAAPAFTSAATFDAAENQTAVGTVVASDGDTDDTVTGYAIQGGADRSTFSIVETTGVLTFASAPNFEAPADADTDNAYVVVVRAASGTGARAKTADQTITVTVTDVAGEAPGVPAAPLVTAASVTSVTAAWTVPANAGPPITDYDYRYRVTAPQGAWTEVTTTAITALSATITGLAEDTGYDVQVRATTDEGTSGWSASGSGSTDANAAPAFTSAATFDAAENQTAVGTVVASDGDADDTVTGYAIQGGADRSTFSIVETTGVLTFASAPNFEARRTRTRTTPTWWWCGRRVARARGRRRRTRRSR